jgi:hypothetical protein
MKGIDPSFKANPAIASQIESKHNTFANDPSAHNLGQPINENNIDAKTGNHKSKFTTDCKVQHSNSLNCIEENYENKGVCEPFFEAYKKCRREEHQRKLEMNAKMSGGGESDGCIIC